MKRKEMTDVWNNIKINIKVRKTKFRKENKIMWNKGKTLQRKESFISSSSKGLWV